MTPADISPEDLNAMVGREIKEGVLLITAPTWYEEEVVPGVSIGQWRVLANVLGTLCVIVVTLHQDHARVGKGTLSEGRDLPHRNEG